MNKFLYFLVILFFTFSVSCIKPIYFGSVENAKVGKVGDKTFQAEVLVPIENPNWFKLTVKDVKLVVSLNSFNLASAKMNNDIIIPAHSKQVYTFPVEVELKELVNGIFAIASIIAEGQANFKIQGNIETGICIFSKTFELKQEHKIKLYSK